MGVPALCHEGMEVFETSLSAVTQEKKQGEKAQMR